MFVAVFGSKTKPKKLDYKRIAQRPNYSTERFENYLFAQSSSRSVAWYHSRRSAIHRQKIMTLTAKFENLKIQTHLKGPPGGPYLARIVA